MHPWVIETCTGHDHGARLAGSFKRPADEFLALSKTAETPFMRAYYERIALRYLSSEGELKATEGRLSDLGIRGGQGRAAGLRSTTPARHCAGTPAQAVGSTGRD